jgi:hypothetical protein
MDRSIPLHSKPRFSERGFFSGFRIPAASTSQAVGSMPVPGLSDRTAALAKLAALSNIPVIAIASI